MSIFYSYRRSARTRLTESGDPSEYPGGGGPAYSRPAPDHQPCRVDDGLALAAAGFAVLPSITIGYC